ncbi:MAG TPA: hypothetical protein PLT45_03035 [Smithella sp.]|nr:hypothetical protein [Smithella sp.]
MKDEKGVSAWAVILLIALLIGAGWLWAKYFAEPTATVMMQGADQAKPAIERAHRAGDAVDQANKRTEDATKQMENNLPGESAE